MIGKGKNGTGCCSFLLGSIAESNFLLLQLYFSFVRELTEICTHSFYDTFQIELLHYF